jgi:hypothetical protein
MNRKLIALIVLVVALFGLIYNIETTARPPSGLAGALQTEGGHEGHEH